MFVTSSAIQNGAFEDKYGKRGTQFSPNGMPTYSIPFEIHDAPQGTKSFAVVLEDKDAITASGFVWIHWLIADLERTVIQENESQTATDYVQGANTWASKLAENWWQHPAALGATDSDIEIIKRQWGAFYGTDLEVSPASGSVAIH